ncbi:MAG: phosphatidylglycerophosphatase A [Gammaproteobacteria bacterium]|nr:phosphatidylglycerophosphatase A [Gammaproteobacteria bacterium]
MSKKKLSASLLKHPIHFLALGFGSGLAAKAPGTFGTLMAIPLYLLIQPLSVINYFIVVLIISLAGIYICDRSAAMMGEHDHPGIVWDEFAGYFITMLAVPFEWFWVLLGFALFRLFDILKPQPIGWLDQHVKGGFGIMLDDVVAGIMAGLCLHLIIWLAQFI